MNKLVQFEERVKATGFNIVYDGLAKRLKNVNQLLILSHIIRQYRMGAAQNGLVPYNRSQFAEMYGISISTQKRAIEKLKDLGFIKIHYKGSTQKAWYELQYENIEKYVFPDGSNNTNNTQVKMNPSMGQNEPITKVKMNPSMGQNEPTYNNILKENLKESQKKEKGEIFKFSNFFPMLQNFFPDAKDKVLKELFSTMDENNPEDIKEFIEIMVAFHYNREAKEQGNYFKQYFKAFIQELDKFKHETVMNEREGNINELSEQQRSYFTMLRNRSKQRIYIEQQEEAKNY